MQDGDDIVHFDTEIEDLVDQDTDTEEDIAPYQVPTEYENIGTSSNADLSDEPDQPKSPTILRSGRVSKPPGSWWKSFATSENHNALVASATVLRMCRKITRRLSPDHMQSFGNKV